MPDITQVVLDEHDWFRRAFAELDETSETEQLSVLWRRLELRLEAHAEAEEAILYPVLLRKGDDAVEETDDAIDDHNDIREASHLTHDATVGSGEWWDAVTAARVENSKHMAEEERGALADFRRNTTPGRRHELGREFVAFLAKRTSIDVPDDYMAPDPDEYIAEHRPTEP